MTTECFKRITIMILMAGIGTLVGCKDKGTSSGRSETPGTTQLSPLKTGSPGPAAGLPRLLDLGADSCIPCKMMKPVLAELKTEFQGKMQVDFIDVWKTPEEGKSFGIQSIPTQIFYDASGKELFRHEGFYSKANILAKWKELGITFEQKNK